MMNPLGRSSPIRMMGLASGMDTDFIIQQSMRVHQMRIDNQMRNRTNLQWRADTHNEIRTQVSNLRNTFLTTQGSQGMLSRSVFNANVATALGSNSDAVTVRALGGSATNTISIGRVERLASGASAGTSEAARQHFMANNTTNNTTLRNLNLANGQDMQWDRNVATVNVGGQDVRITRNAEGAFSFTRSNGAELPDNVAASADAAGNVTISVTTEGEDGTTTTTTREFTLATDGPLAGEQFSFQQAAGHSRTLDFGGEEVLLRWNGTNFTANNGATVSVARNADDTGYELTVTRGTGDDAETQTFGWDAETRTLTDEAGTAEELGVHYETRNVSFFGQKDIMVRGSARTEAQGGGYNYHTIRLTSDMTVNQMVSAFNNSVADVRMSFEPLTGRFNVQSASTGADATLTFGAGSEDFLSGLGIGGGTTNTDGSLSFEGQSAVVYINNTRVESSSNTFTYGGVSITLNRITDGQFVNDDGEIVGSAAENITINISRDIDGVVGRIREFIDAYNSLVQRIENLISERRAPHEVSYGPLTDEEKSVMTERQIEQWEEIARRGIMRNDNALTNLANSLRRELFETVSSAGIAPHDIGLTTGRFDAGTGGQIILNEDRLRAALEEDPDRVANVFMGIAPAGSGETGGLLWRLNDVMRRYDGAQGGGSRAIRNLEDSIRRNNEQVERMQLRMFQEEDRLFRQFAAMETAMSRLQSQGDWFTAMLGSL